jgi:Mce-associated membrane protein
MTELLGRGRDTQSLQDSDAWSESQDELDDVDAAAAEATALAACARARADRLRRQACDADGESDDPPVDFAVEASADAAPQRGRRWPTLVCVAVAVLLIVATGAASGYMVWQHRAAVRDRQLTAEFAAAARQSVVTLMSMNFQNAQQDVQRVVDNSTGEFHDDFAKTADDFIKVVQDSKVVTTVAVNQTAVQSKTTDSATVLVAATSRITNSAGAQQAPRAWRLVVTLVRDGSQLKMSKVEFVP